MQQARSSALLNEDMISNEAGLRLLIRSWVSSWSFIHDIILLYHHHDRIAIVISNLRSDLNDACKKNEKNGMLRGVKLGR